MDENNEFESAFAEFASANDKELNGDTSRQDDDLSDDDGQVTPQVTPQDAGHDGYNVDQDAGAGSNTEQAGQSEIDWKKEAETWKHKALSDQGRVSALTRQNEELKAAVKHVSTSDGDGPTSSETRDALKDPEKWEQYKEQWPDEAEALEEFFAHRSKKIKEEVIGEISPYLQRMREQDAQDSATQFRAAIADDNHKDWEQTWNSQEFARWFYEQPPGVQSLHQSTNPADIHYLLDSFKATTGRAKSDASKVVESRQRRLQAAVDIKGKGVPRAELPEDDFESAFAYYASKK